MKPLPQAMCDDCGEKAYHRYFYSKRKVAGTFCKAHSETYLAEVRAQWERVHPGQTYPRADQHKSPAKEGT